MGATRRPCLLLRLTALPTWTPRRVIAEALEIADRLPLVVEVVSESGADLWSVAPGDSLPDEVKGFTANLSARGLGWVASEKG